MTPKEKALEIVRKKFEIIAKAVNYKGLKKEGDKKFYAIEKIAKDCSLITVDEIIKHLTPIEEAPNNKDAFNYWDEVKEEIKNL